MVVVAPPREWYDRNGFDDSDFYRARERWELLSIGDHGLFKDPSRTLARLLGHTLLVSGDHPFNNPFEERLRIVEERKLRDRLFDSLIERGLLDPDHYYLDYHDYGEFKFAPPADQDRPEVSTHEIEPERLVDDDPRKFWTHEQGKSSISYLREEIQDLVLQAFLAGREFERNSVRDLHQDQLRQRTGLRRKGRKAKSSGEIIQHEISKMIERGTPLDQIKPKSLKEFVLRKSQNKEWKTLIEGTRRSARKKKGFDGDLGELEDTAQDPGMNCFKNGLAEYRKKMGKGKCDGSSKKTSSRKASAKQKKARKAGKRKAPGKS